jgi:hypothetical protein
MQTKLSQNYFLMMIMCFYIQDHLNTRVRDYDT